ncbi:hypothetical protein FO519_001624 [Halicephalobus sp. NKZ332]|nr:hypothetical protein FO519_001624 [Halicephalobus sp. NKZ332]
MNRGGFGNFHGGLSARGRFTSASSNTDANNDAVHGGGWGAPSNEDTSTGIVRGGSGSGRGGFSSGFGLRGGFRNNSAGSSTNANTNTTTGGDWSNTQVSQENASGTASSWDTPASENTRVATVRGGFGSSRGESGSSRGWFNSFRGGFGTRGQLNPTSSSADTNTNAINGDDWGSAPIPEDNSRSGATNDWGTSTSGSTSVPAIRGGFGTRGGFGSSSSINATQISKENPNDAATNNWSTSANENSTVTTRGGFGSIRGGFRARGGFSNIGDGVSHQESTIGSGRGAVSSFGRSGSDAFSLTGDNGFSSRGGFSALQIGSSRGGSGANSQPIGSSRGGYGAEFGGIGSTRGGLGSSFGRFTANEAPSTTSSWSIGNTNFGSLSNATKNSRPSEFRGKFQMGGTGGDPDTENYVRYVPVVRETEVLFAEDQVVSEKYANVIDEDEEVVVEDFTGEVMTLGRWEEAEFEPELVANLRKCNYIRPRKIQTTVIPFIIDSFDVKGHAETGSGKTAAYLLPILDMCIKAKNQKEFNSASNTPYAVIIAPTRELVLQISEQARKFADGTSVSVAKAYGQYSMGLNAREIRTGCDILCAAPGRLKHFVTSNEINLASVKFLVIDEADRLILEYTFLDDIRAVLEHRTFPSKENRQTLIFSATFPEEMKEATKELLKSDAVFITNKKNIVNKRIVQDFRLVTGNKLDEMTEMLEKEVSACEGDATKIRRTLIFTNTKKLSDFIAIHLCNKGIKASCINGDRTQQLREEALGQFRRGEVAVLVSTDVCCRGIDIKHLDHVINYDIPMEVNQYIHRIGRTGRICQGYATTFVTDPCEPVLQEIVQVIRESGKELPESLSKLLDSSTQLQGFGNFNVDGTPTMTVLNQEDW